MTIDRRDSNFIANPTAVPLNAAAAINSSEGKIDPIALNIFKAFLRDLEEYKKSIVGFTRRFDNMLFLYNNPTQKETDIREAIRMDKYGFFSFGTEYPRWPRARIDVNGALYAIPQFGIWEQTNILAGVGLYTWNTEVFNPNSDIYKRSGGNTTITITEPGTYDVRATVMVEDDVSADPGERTDVTLNHNANVILSTAFTAGSLAGPNFYTSHVLNTLVANVQANDTIDVELIGPVGANRFGDANHFSKLVICKVN